MKTTELSNLLSKMLKETKNGTLNWKISVQTTEGAEEKYKVTEEGRTWTVDECYVSFSCHYRGEEFCLITYELMKSNKLETKTINYVFLPPMGVRLFSLHTLLPYSVESDAMLISQVHMLWEELIGLKQQESGQVEFHITEAAVTIQDDV